MKGQAQMFSTGGDGDRWATPPDVFAALDAEFGFTLDAAALSTNRKVAAYLGPDHELVERRDGLLHPWGPGPTWCNPPYSLAGDFAEAAQRQAVHFDVVSVLLVFARTDTRWWWANVLGRDPETRERMPVACAAEIRWRPGRVTFLDPLTGSPRLDAKGRPQSAPAPSVAIVYRGACRADWPANGVL